MIYQSAITVPTSGRGMYDITAEVAAAVAASGAQTASCQVFLRHTSASLIICENADPAVMQDLEAWMSRAVPDGDPLFVHTAEGPDDMPAHVRTVLTQTSIYVPISEGRMGLGTWQGIFLWEHRLAAHKRQLLVTVNH